MSSTLVMFIFPICQVTPHGHESPHILRLAAGKSFFGEPWYMYIQWFMLVLLVGSCCGHFLGGAYFFWPEGMVLQGIPSL